MQLCPGDRLNPRVRQRGSQKSNDATIGWDRCTGRTGIVLGMRSFGFPTPIAVVAEHFGFTGEHMVKAAKQAITMVMNQGTRQCS
jgi:transketolase